MVFRTRYRFDVAVEMDEPKGLLCMYDWGS